MIYLILQKNFNVVGSEMMSMEADGDRTSWHSFSHVETMYDCDMDRWHHKDDEMISDLTRTLISTGESTPNSHKQKSFDFGFEQEEEKKQRLDV